jgi:hypothetical protein
MLLISSAVTVVLSPSTTVLNVGHASATSSSEDNDGDGGSNTDDATTTGEEEDGDKTEQQEENNQQQDVQQEGTEDGQQGQLLPSPFTQEQEDQDVEAEAGEQEEQLAFMGGEICNDFEDNDGDGWIDLADPDCGAAAGPATQGALTAPTTPPPSASTANATNSTINTLTSGLIGLPSSPATPPTTTTTPQGVEQGQQQSPSSAETTPQSPPPTTTTTTTPQGGEQGQQQVPGTIAPAIARTTTFPGGISITKNPDGRVDASIPDSGVIISFGPNGGVEDIEHPNGVLSKNRDGSVSAMLPDTEGLRLRPDGIGDIGLADDDETTITGNRDGTITVEKPYGTSTYSLDGKVATTNPDGTSTSTMIGSVNGGTTTFPGGISITKNPDGRVDASIPDSKVPGSEVKISFGPKGGVEFIDHPNGMLYRHSDGGVSALLRSDEELRLRPDGIGEIDLDEDGTIDITGNRDGTLTISKPITDPATGVETEGASMTTTYKAPP